MHPERKESMGLEFKQKAGRGKECFQEREKRKHGRGILRKMECQMVKISNDILRKKHHTGSWKTVGRIRGNPCRTTVFC